MALQAESLVEEWFNRNGYFTIRGVKDKIDELDILAIKSLGNGKWNCVHCEVQVSIRPVGYISKLTSELVEKLGVKSKTSAKKRSDSQLEICAKSWVSNKFTAEKKKQIREQFNPESEWWYTFVHGNVKDAKELEFIAAEGIQLLPFKKILEELCAGKTQLDLVGSSAGDLVEIIKFIQD